MDLRKISDRLFYKDRATVFRAVHTTIGRTDDYTTDYEEVIADMPCRLSVSHERPTEHRDDVSQKQTFHYTMFHEDKYKILSNDLVKVVHRGGQEMTFFAGNSFQYETGHIETQIRRRKEAGQS